MRHVPQRRYAEQPTDDVGRHRLRDTDSADRAFRIKAAVYSVAGGVLGSMAGARIGGLWGVLGLVGGWAMSYGIIMGLMHTAGRAASTVYAPTGTSTPATREYSEAQALAARGLYAEAARLYEAHAAEFREDPAPCFAVARIMRDHLADPEAAAGWFRRARRDAHLSAGQEMLVAQELIELYTKRLGQPQRAIPELARIPQLLPGSPQAAAAEREIATLRATLREEGESA